jgi:glycine cleavage system H protein
MRRHRPPPEIKESRLEVRPASELRPDRRYSENHCWIQDQRNGRVRVGVEPELASALLPLKEIVYPTPGQRLTQGRTCLWIAMEAETFALKSPLDGFLKAVNEPLVASPHLLQAQPFERGWLFELDGVPTDDGGDGSMELESAAAAYAADLARLRISLRDALRGRNPGAGTTPEGGDLQIEGIVRLLGPSRYLKLLRQAFRN